MRGPRGWWRAILAEKRKALRQHMFARAERLRREGRYDLAHRELWSWLRWQPQDHQARWLLRRLPLAPDLERHRALWEEGRAGEALALLDTLLVRFPLEPEVHLLAAAMAVERNDTQDAAAYARRAVEIDPDDPHTLVQAATWAEPADPEWAGACLERVRPLLAEHPERPEYFVLGNELLHLEGRLALRQGRYKDALDPLKRAFATEPHRVGYAIDLATVCLALGQRESARDVVARALEHSPGDERLQQFQAQTEDDGAPS